MSALAFNPLMVTKTTDADLSAKAYFIVVEDGGDVVLAANGTAAPLGILGADVNDGSTTRAAVAVQMGGVGIVELGDTVSAGDFIMSDANGNGITATTGKYYCGRVDVDGVDGQQVPILITFGQLA